MGDTQALSGAAKATLGDLLRESVRDRAVLAEIGVLLAPVLALDLGVDDPRSLFDELEVAVGEQGERKGLRRVRFTTELWENGYFFSDEVEVDYCDGDSDEITLPKMFLEEYADELTSHTDGLGSGTELKVVYSGKEPRIVA